MSIICEWTVLDQVYIVSYLAILRSGIKIGVHRSKSLPDLRMGLPLPAPHLQDVLEWAGSGNQRNGCKVGLYERLYLPMNDY